MKPTLVIMAAGMGSRYGGLKQIDEIDDKGHIIIDFSIYDALEAGFDKVVFVIKHEIEEEFKEKVGKRLEKVTNVEYVYQELDKLPAGYSVPSDRKKPWGTAHAIWCCKDVVKEPFAVINSDDYYGKDAFKEIYKELSTYGEKEDRCCMVGYVLRNTLTENGYVSRGVCSTDSADNLLSIKERTRIIKTESGAAFSEDDGASWTDIDDESIVSMNLWGFAPDIIDKIDSTLHTFLDNEVPANPMKSECFLPTVVQNNISDGKINCKVLKCTSRWFGVTYKEDKEDVVKAIQNLKERGDYPDLLWTAYPYDKFKIEGQVISCEKYGNGHINDTYLVTVQDGDKSVKYILQKMNTSIFTDPDGLMNNIKLVTDFIRSSLRESGGDTRRGTITIIPAKNGDIYYKAANDDAWRMYEYVEGTISYETVENEKVFEDCAFAFGNFQSMLSSFDASKLVETIPGFHNTPKRFVTFEKAIEEDALGRADSVREEIQFYLDRKEDMESAQKMLEEGKMPLRVTHNDTKLNNILVDKETKKGLCVIDLDTVMPGLAIFDFGDSIRFGANTAVEDEKDLSKVSLSLKYFEAYVKGFIEGCNGALTDTEISMLPMGAKIMTLECGMRFLTDYLEGDHYFKIAREEHNLDRTRTQIELVKDMERKWQDMLDIVDKYIKK